jgi:predicted phosphodiesterase
VRIAVVSDIHGNLTAFEAVLADLRQAAPDLIFHGGDLADSGSSPLAIIDRIRELGWPGVLGNTDQMLVQPESLTSFASQAPYLQGLFATIAEIAQAARETLGEERIDWLRGLPPLQIHDSLVLVHASPGNPWRAPGSEASDAELWSIYSPLRRPVAIYAHIHQPYVRLLPGMTVANTGGVSLSYDGDNRAAYLLLNDGTPEIRRVAYDVDKEIKLLSTSGLPHADWIGSILRSATFRMP